MRNVLEGLLAHDDVECVQKAFDSRRVGKRRKVAGEDLRKVRGRPPAGGLLNRGEGLY